MVEEDTELTNAVACGVTVHGTAGAARLPLIYRMQAREAAWILIQPVNTLLEQLAALDHLRTFATKLCMAVS